MERGNGGKGDSLSCLDFCLPWAALMLDWKTRKCPRVVKWPRPKEGEGRVDSGGEREGPKGISHNLGLFLLMAVCALGERKRAPREQGHLLQFVGSPHLPFWCTQQRRPDLGNGQSVETRKDPERSVKCGDIVARPFPCARWSGQPGVGLEYRSNKTKQPPL